MTEDYNFKLSEEQLKQFWAQEKIYRFKPGKKIYSIDTPPPTVSGKMHIGHAFSYSQQDFIARYKRMQGFNVFYPFGTDDNGLPTERLVEKTKGIRARDMERSEFIKTCMDFLKSELPKFIKDWKDIGISADFDIYYSTINEHSRKISQWSFLDLWKKKRAYRKEAPSMWCPECQTGVSQVEVKDKEINTTFNNILFEVDGKKLEIATTRPELLPACVAVFYNPQDLRFKKYKGKKALVPLFNFEVPIIEDIRALKDKGTGIVMCCTFGDQTDMEWQKAHNLEIKEAISKNGKMTALAGKYSGMGIKEARKAIIEDLRLEGLLVKQEQIKHAVNVHERCETEIEFVKSKQWFIKYLDLKDKMLKWGSGLKWHPKFMKVRYENWIKGLQWDWLVSNQRYFGIPFPVWYCKKCGKEILAEEKDLPVDPLKDKPKKKCSCGNENFEPEKDVLNTWFTSSMTPQIATKLMPESLQNKIFPMSLRPQAHEIITFWLFNTVFKSNIHFNKNPWKDVMISGFVTLEGEKMSKSKGNVIEPQTVLERYGADSLRYWASSSKLGEDLDYQEKELVTGKKFVTKIWNASKFIFQNLKLEKKAKLEEIDRIFLTRLNNVIEKVTDYFEEYEYAKAREETINFFRHDFCDNYLEIVKNRVYSGKKKESAEYALYHILLSILKLMAPITPFITDELYLKYFQANEQDLSIHISKWPKKLEVKSTRKDEEIWNILIDLLGKVRHSKSKAQKSMKAEIILTIEPETEKQLSGLIEDLKAVTCAREIRTGKFRVEFV